MKWTTNKLKENISLLFFGTFILFITVPFLPEKIIMPVAVTLFILFVIRGIIIYKKKKSGKYT